MTEAIVEDTVVARGPIITPQVRRVKAATKAHQVSKILARARGATLAEITIKTGWQPHSARAFLSGLRKLGIVLVKEERKTGETSYRINNAGLGS